METGDKMRGEKEVPVTLFCCRINRFLVTWLSQFCGVDYMLYGPSSFANSRTFIFLLTCDHARLFQFVQFPCGSAKIKLRFLKTLS